MELFLFSIVIASLKSPELAIPPLTGLVVNAHVLVSHKRFFNLKKNTKFKLKTDFFCIGDIKVCKLAFIFKNRKNIFLLLKKKIRPNLPPPLPSGTLLMM